MPTSAEFQAGLDKAVTNMDRLDAFINGPVDGTVVTDNGTLPSLAKVIEDLPSEVTTNVDVAEAAASASAVTSVAQAAVATAQAAIATAQATLALTAGSTGNPYPNTYATTLPKGVTSGTIGGTAITGATPGTYALTAVGGSITGVQANLVVLTATTARIDIVNTGLGSGTTPPTWANPSGATLPGGTTLTAVVGSLVPTTGRYWAATSDSKGIALWSNDGTATPAAVNNPDATQVVLYGKAGVDAAKAAVDAIAEQFRSLVSLVPGSPDFLGVFLDQEDNILAQILTDQAAWRLILESVRTADGITIERVPITSAADAGLYLIDENDNIVARQLAATDSNAEVVEARGSRSALADRIDTGLTAYGSARGEFAYIERMYEFRTLLGLLAAGRIAQLDVGCLGDSQHDGGGFNAAKDFADQLIADYGDAGWGFTGDVNISGANYTTTPQPRGDIRDQIAVTYNGDWLQEYVEVSARFPNSVAAPDTPDMCGIQSATAGRMVSHANLTTGAPLSDALWIYTDTTDGQGEYRWGTYNSGTIGNSANYTFGSWTTVAMNVSPGSVKSASIATGMPTGGGLWMLQRRVASGTVRSCGMNYKSAQSGVRVHNFAASSARASDLAARDATKWRAGIAPFQIDSWLVAHMTNDSGGSRTPAQFATSAATIVTNLRAVNPVCDLCWIGAFENKNDAAHGMAAKVAPMSDYTAQAEALMATNKGALIDLQYTFGDVADYGADAKFLASFSGTTMTVTGSNLYGTFPIAQGMYVWADSEDQPDGAQIVPGGSGTGGAGTYTLDRDVGTLAARIVAFSIGRRCLMADSIHPSQRRGRATMSSAYGRALNPKRG
jgi:hypothetical protein